MEAFLDPLLPLFERERAAGRALAAGVPVRTAGSTYRKPGALMVIAANGEYARLLSGGCLEGDLRAHAQTLITTGTARPVRYELRGESELLWGLGIGCEGDMQILLLRAGPDNAWQPLGHLAAAARAGRPSARRPRAAVGGTGDRARRCRRFYLHSTVNKPMSHGVTPLSSSEL